MSEKQFLPLQGGGEVGDGGSLHRPKTPSPPAPSLEGEGVTWLVRETAMSPAVSQSHLESFTLHPSLFTLHSSPFTPFTLRAVRAGGTVLRPLVAWRMLAHGYCYRAFEHRPRACRRSCREAGSDGRDLGSVFGGRT